MSTATLKRRKLDFHTWDDVLADIDHLQRAGYDRAGNWDLSQIIDHVSEGLLAATNGNPHRGPWILRTPLGRLLVRFAIFRRGMPAGMKVPDWWLPGPAHDESAAVNKFRDEIANFEAMTTKPHPHPFFGNLSKQEWRNLVIVHTMHHLSFLVPRT